MNRNMKVLYVMGEGRSGSTLLDMLLSNQQEIMGVGELWSFFEDDDRRTGLCSCGKAYSECEFWQAVKANYLARTGQPDLKLALQLHRQHDGARWLILKLLGVRKKGYATYCKYMHELFLAIAEVSGKPVVVDSTKQVGRAYNLLKCPKLDVYLIHLVRDGRGILWSRLRDSQRNPGEPRGLRRKIPLYDIVAWTMKNAYAALVGKVARKRYMLLRYEDLVRDPATEMRRVGQLCDIDMESLVAQLQDPENNSLHSGHQIGGNTRARTSGQPIRLKLDDEWHSRLPSRQRFMFWLLAGWLARKFGYARVPAKTIAKKI